MSQVPSTSSTISIPRRVFNEGRLGWVFVYDPEDDDWVIQPFEVGVNPYNYSKALQRWKVQHEGDWDAFRIRYFSLEEHPCACWAESNNMLLEELLFLQHPFAFEHMSVCMAYNSFHYKLFYQKQVNSVERATRYINAGWRLNRFNNLTTDGI